MNIFERAARGQYRYPTSKGEITTEQLFQLPLTSRNGADLDTIAIGLDSAIEDQPRKSFVAASDNSAERSELECKLDIVKSVIASKMATAAAAETRAAKAEKRRRIVDAMAKREDADLEGKSMDELTAELAALDE